MSVPSVIGMPKGMNKAAFSGNLNCPWEECQSRSIRFVEYVSTYRIRYRCRKCGKTFQYDISNRLDHPFAPYKKQKWLRYVEGWAFTKGRKLKQQGVIQ